MTHRDIIPDRSRLLTPVDKVDECEAGIYTKRHSWEISCFPGGPVCRCNLGDAARVVVRRTTTPNLECAVGYMCVKEYIKTHGMR